MNPEKKALNAAVLTSIVGSTLTGCIPSQNNSSVQEPIPKKRMIEQEDLVVEQEFEIEERKKGSFDYGDYNYTEDETFGIEEVTMQEVKECNAAKEVYEEFDYSILDIGRWNHFELDSVEQKEPGYVVTVEYPTSFFVISITNDEFLDQEGKVEEIILKRGMPLEISEVRKLTGPDGEQITLGLVANTFGAKAVSAVVMRGEDSLGTEMSFVKEAEGSNSAVAYVTRAENIYPNKVYNTYRALLNISQFQDKKGPLKAGEENSFIEMIGLLNSTKKSQYLMGLMSSGLEVRAGGVCAMATGMSLLVHQDENNKILEQWDHPTRYFQGPFSMSPYKVDATVQLDDKDDYDFRWEFANDTYLQINVDMSPSAVSYSDTALDGVGGLSDVNAVFSISLTDKYPEGQTARLQEQMNEYLEFRNSKHLKVFESYESSTYPVEQFTEAINLIFNREDISIFEEEIKTSEVLQDMLAFQEAVNSYEENPDVVLSDYLKGTDWYANYINNPSRSKEEADYALRIMSYVRIKGQPLQCVSYVAILPMLYPELQMQAIGGSGVASAKDLVSGHVSLTGSSGTGFGGLLMAGKNLGIKDYNVADIFVTINGKFGHVGAIVAVKEDEKGERFLLVVDSNRMVDGKIKSFVVNERSLENIVGPHHRYLIRSAANHSTIVAQEEVTQGN